MSLQDDLLWEHIDKVVARAVTDAQEARCAAQGHQGYEKDELEYSEKYPQCRWCGHYLLPVGVQVEK